jgi:hypothetical protein
MPWSPAAPGEPAPTGSDLEFLDVVRDVVLFCRDASGRPIGYPMRTVACERTALVFTTYRKSAKVRHMERDPRVCVLASRVDGSSVRWVSMEGVASIVVPSDGEIERAMGGSGPPAPGGPAEPRVPAGMGDFVKQRLREGKRVLVRVEHLTTAGRSSRAGA